MKKHLYSILGFSSVAMSLLLMGSCKSDSNSSGFEYMPDMYRSPAIETYVDYGEIRGKENKELKSVLSAMTPPKYTIPYIAGKDSAEVRLMLPYFRKPNVAFRETHGLYGFDVSTADEYLLAVNDKNPYAITAKNSEEVLKKGKELFTAMCQHCHGEKGDGAGPMVASGAYVGVPNYATLTNLSDGQIFYSIYYGKGMMGSHGSVLNKKEIWTLVHYVRQFQNKDYGKFDATGNPVALVAAPVDSTKMKP
jgi:mono/diheme cytochrome c family protein